MNARYLKEVPLGDVLRPEQVLANMTNRSKKAAIEDLVDVLYKHKLVSNKAEAVARIMEREELCPTTLGGGVAIPHARLDVGERPSIAVGRHMGGLDFGSPDSGPVNLIVLVIWQPEQAGLFNRLFAGLVSKLADSHFKNRLMEEKGAGEIAAALADVKVDMLKGRATKCEADMLIALQCLEMKRRAKAKGLEGQIDLARAELSGSMLSRFDRLMEHFGEALVEAPDGICRGCNMQLSSGFASEMLRNADTVYVCERCGRFLIHHIG
ncbi:MAG: PTS sugar transporter subunit IIA [Proteobacteria bacterium]|nr:PTS sugar transporter subunit IIA [Pseudomonadota bacterium]